MENQQWTGQTSAGEHYYSQQPISNPFEMEQRQWATAGPSYSMPSEQWPQLQYTSDETVEAWSMESGKAGESSIVVKTETLLPAPYSVQTAPSLSAPSTTPAAPAPADGKRADKDGKIKPYKARKGKKKGINTPSPVETSKLRRKIRKSSREKQRRLEINQKFEKLCKILHLGPAGRVKAEKLTILSETIDIISTLRAENAELRLQKANLRTQLSSFDRKRPAPEEATQSADSSQSHVPADAASSAPCLLPCCVPAYSARPRASSTESEDGHTAVRERAQSDASTSSAPSADELAANDDASSGDESEADADSPVSHDGEESPVAESYPAEATYQAPQPQQSGLASPSARLSSISLTDERGSTTTTAAAPTVVAGTRTVAPTNQYSVAYSAPAPAPYHPQAPALSSPFGSVTELDQAMAFGGLQEASLVLSTETMAPPNDLAEIDSIDADFFGSMDDEL